jgi:hemolysin activation/secretion protein
MSQRIDGCVPRALPLFRPFIASILIALAFPALGQTPIPTLQAPPEPLRRPPIQQVEPGVIPGPAAAGATPVPAGAERIPVTPVAIDVDGTTVYSQADLAPLIQPLIGRTTNAAEIFKLAAAIERKYHDDGYFLAIVAVPPQRVADGRVRLRVYEGSISNVVVEGDVGPVVEQARAYLEKIGGKQAVNLRDIERYMLLTQDIPGIKTRAVMRPGKEPGVSELVVQLERKVADLLNQVDNRGSSFTGPAQGLLTGGLNSFTQFGERFEATYFTTFNRESNFGQIAGSFLIGSEGLRVRSSTPTRAGSTAPICACCASALMPRIATR